MPHDSIPPADADFNNWVNPFSAYVGLHHATLGVDTSAITLMGMALAAWTPAYAAIQNPDTTTPPAIRSKNEARAALETILRPLIRQIQAYPAVTDDMRTSMGLHIRDTTHTPAPVPATAPLAKVDTSRRLSHIIDFRDAAAPQRRARPAGVHGCEIWSKVGGPAPASISDLAYVATDTATPYLVEYDIAQGGQTVFYWLRWVNRRGDHGPWSEVVAATIPG